MMETRDHTQYFHASLARSDIMTLSFLAVNVLQLVSTQNTKQHSVFLRPHTEFAGMLQSFYRILW